VRLVLVGNDHGAIDPTAAQSGDHALRDVTLAIVAPRDRKLGELGCRSPVYAVRVIALGIMAVHGESE
jgi:hypothetical protein